MSSATNSKRALSFSSRVFFPAVSSSALRRTWSSGSVKPFTAALYHSRKSAQLAKVEPTTTGSTSLSLGASGSSGMLGGRSEEHTSELQSLTNLVCRLPLEKQKLD